MGLDRTRNGSIEIAYETFGPPSGAPVLLVMAACMQMNFWHDDFCAELVHAGFRVVRFDNRDSGLSTHLPSRAAHHGLRTFAHPRSVAPYDLTEMASDALAVLDALSLDAVHVVGFSMGGMIAQTMALEHAPRVKSLTLLSSLPGWRPWRMKYRLLPAGIRIARRHVQTPADAGQRLAELFTLVGSPGFPTDEDWLRQVGAEAFDRDPEPLFAGWSGPLTAAERQIVAVGASGDLLPRLGRIDAPTLVIHGDADPIVHPRAPRAIAATIAHARRVCFRGMGHDLPKALWSPIIEELSNVAIAPRRHH